MKILFIDKPMWLSSKNHVASQTPFICVERRVDQIFMYMSNHEKDRDNQYEWIEAKLFI